jgi:hypothetical protein
LLWISRSLIGLVLFFNLECALLFLWSPQDYAAGFGVQGTAGNLIVRSVGLLFVMWNVPYLVAFLQPVKHRIALIEAVAMQSIGLVGETILYLTLAPGLAAVSSTLSRFIWFDGFGLLCLGIALWLARKR